MENLPTFSTVSLTEFREPNKLISKVGNQPVAIFNRDELIGYFVPKGAVVDIELVDTSNQQIAEFFDKQLPKITHVLDYLKDK
jgi:hypothetical protein